VAGVFGGGRRGPVRHLLRRLASFSQVIPKERGDQLAELGAGQWLCEMPIESGLERALNLDRSRPARMRNQHQTGSRALILP